MQGGQKGTNLLIASSPGRARMPEDTGRYPEVGWPLLLLFLFYTVFLYLQGGVRFPALGAIRLEFILGALLGPIALVKAGRWWQVDGARRVVGWSIALLLCMALMVALSKYPAYSWDVFLDRGLKFSIFGLCIASFVSSPRLLRLFVFAYMLAFFRMGYEGLLGSLDGSLIWENQEIPRLHGTTPNYAHPNSFSGTQLGVLPFVLYLFPLLPWYWRAALTLQLLFVGNVVLRTGSRTGYLGLIAGILSVVLLTGQKMKMLVIVVVLAMVAVPFIPAEYLSRFESTFSDSSQAGEDTSIGKRKEILIDAGKVFATHPLGVGVGAFPGVRGEMFGRYQDTHNLYLEVATNLGLQGLLIFTGLLASLWAVLHGVRKQVTIQIEELRGAGHLNEEATGHLQDLEFMRACAKAVIIFLVIRLSLGMFGMDLYEIYWWFSGGLAIALARTCAVAAVRTRALVAAASARPVSA